MNTTDVELATFGAGCFWSTEKYFRKEFDDKLKSFTVGYIDDILTSNSDKNSYDRINSIEVLQVSFQKQYVTYDHLVRFFFHMHDPTTLNRTNNHQYSKYRSIIFTHNNQQQKIAEQIRDELKINGKIKGEIITQIELINQRKFNIAEEKHQNYINKKYGWLIQS